MTSELYTFSAGNLSDGKQNIQVQYSTNNQQTMYNAPCSIYNVPTITLPPNPSHTYIIQEASHQGQNLQPTFIQQVSDEDITVLELAKPVIKWNITR